MRRIRAEPVFRKLHGPVGYAAGNAASYTLTPFRQDRAWICRMEDLHGQSKGIQNEISVACNAIMSVQYVIIYYIVGPTCRGLNGHIRASLEI